MPSSLSDVDTVDAAAVLDRAPCALVQTSEDGLIRRVNQTFCTWFGYSAEALVGVRRFQDLLTMGGRIFHQTHWAPLLRMQGSISEVKLELLHADGSTLPVVLNAVRHEDGGVVVHELAGYVARDRDKYEQELVASRKRLEVLVSEAHRHHAEVKERAVFAEQMIGIVSHDLRNPLSSISMATTLLGQSDLAPAQQRFLGNIQRSTERANRLIADLLDFTQARIGSGIAVDLKPIDLRATVAEAVEELRLIYPTRRLEHVHSGESGCLADGARLVQLLGNLVSNAMTYGAADSAVMVTSTLDDATVALAVQNRGPVIPGPLQERLFEPMARGTSSKNTGRSVGLGLFIVREIAKAHQGTVAVRSDAEEGTTFTMTMPRRA